MSCLRRCTTGLDQVAQALFTPDRLLASARAGGLEMLCCDAAAMTADRTQDAPLQDATQDAPRPCLLCLSPLIPLSALLIPVSAL
jgi:hypothetical protein